MDDFIIVGAGSAGCVLANRLSRHARVTLIEAGPADHRWDPRLHMPAALSFVLASSWYNWAYQSEPEPHLNHRRMYCPRGKVLGGSSSINGMIFVRGNRGDFDNWAGTHQLPDWEYDACLPYFKRSENVMFAHDETRGDRGPLPITRGDSNNPLNAAWLAAGTQAGYPLTDDFNGRSQEGFGAFDRSIFKGIRQNAARAYLDSARHRATLTVMTNTQVNRILIKDGRATGVEVRRHGSIETLAAGKVILCGGAINSPQLLMLSGIGGRQALSAINMATHVNLPGVGQNLQDHLEIYVQYACKQPVSVYPATRWYNMPGVGLNWLLRKQGAGATNHFETGAFLKSDPSKPYPDLQFHFLPIAMDYDGKDQYRGHGFQLHTGPMKATSRGSVRLRSSHPKEPPVIQFNYHETPEDRATMKRAIHLAEEIVSQPAFDAYRDKRLRPLDMRTDQAIEDFIAQHAESAYHPSGTCRMGVDDDAVVDSNGKVHGLTDLHICDASIMPEITNGNLNAPVIMMAEKISDALLGHKEIDGHNNF